jgi:coenzyme F420-reducing hydrogenase delta subunit
MCTNGTMFACINCMSYTRKNTNFKNKMCTNKTERVIMCTNKGKLKNKFLLEVFRNESKL